MTEKDIKKRTRDAKVASEKFRSDVTTSLEQLSQPTAKTSVHKAVSGAKTAPHKAGSSMKKK